MHFENIDNANDSGLRKQKLTKFSGDSRECSGPFDVIFHQKQLSDTENRPCSKISPMCQAKAAKFGMGFSSQSHYYAWDTLCEKLSRSDVKLNAQFKKIHIRAPVRHNDSMSIVRFANVFTNALNSLTHFGCTSDLE